MIVVLFFIDILFILLVAVVAVVDVAAVVAFAMCVQDTESQQLASKLILSGLKIIGDANVPAGELTFEVQQNATCVGDGDGDARNEDTSPLSSSIEFSDHDILRTNNAVADARTNTAVAEVWYNLDIMLSKRQRQRCHNHQQYSQNNAMWNKLAHLRSIYVYINPEFQVVDFAITRLPKCVLALPGRGQINQVPGEWNPSWTSLIFVLYESSLIYDVLDKFHSSCGTIPVSIHANSSTSTSMNSSTQNQAATADRHPDIWSSVLSDVAGVHIDGTKNELLYSVLFEDSSQMIDYYRSDISYDMRGFEWI